MPEVEIYTQPWCPYCARAKNLLERKGVDYVLLEAREEIAPPVGASVAFFANAARILDQLRVPHRLMQRWGEAPAED